MFTSGQTEPIISMRIGAASVADSGPSIPVGSRHDVPDGSRNATRGTPSWAAGGQQFLDAVPRVVICRAVFLGESPAVRVVPL